jgi:uncharacterized protein (DUF1800 family)
MRFGHLAGSSSAVWEWAFHEIFTELLPLAPRLCPLIMALRTEQEKTAHLLRRFGLGASEAELDYYGEGGHRAAIDRLINFEEVQDNWIYPLEMVRNPQGNLPMQAVQAFWYSRILTTNRPLQEKMTLFWHDHFATSGMKVDVGLIMDNHVNLLRTHALGKFPTMLEEVSKDPAMLFWLDNHENLKGKPNENFAREVMELFTLGIGHYSEKDVQEAARAFTGWTFGRTLRGGRIARGEKPRAGMGFAFDQLQHDDGEKSVLGRRGAFNGDDVLKILCDEPQTPRFITRKMWEWFAYPNPDINLVERLATRYRQSGMDNKVLVRAIMESPEFYSEEAEKGVIKSPVDFCISTSRALGLGAYQIQLLNQAQNAEDENAQRRPLALGGLLLQTTKAMGMTLMMPPDVAGWEIGQGWISSATMVERMKWADRLFSNLGRPVNPGGGGAAIARQLRSVQDEYYFQMVGGTSSPEEMVDQFLSIIDAPALMARKEPLVSAAMAGTGGQVTPGNIRGALGLVARAVFGSPEFQFA